jgi:hypothetical protein
VHSDGSVDYKSFTIYALPDHLNLGEPPDSSPVCNTSKKCVLYIGTNQTDIPKSKYFFSQAWSVTPTAGDTGKDPGSGGSASTGGFPTAVVIVLVAVVVVALALLGMRARTRRTRRT